MSNFDGQLRAGNYEGEVISQELTTSKGGYTTFEIKFGNLIHAETGAGVPETHRIVRLYLSDNAAEYTHKKLATAGFEGSVDQFILESSDAISIIGNIVPLYMKNGEHGEDWDFSLGGGGGSSTMMDEITAKQEAARWSHLMAKGVPTPKPSAATVPAEREPTF